MNVYIDADLGGRWKSLRSAEGREWLWSRPDSQRAGVRPGDAFVDAGGLEECIPTVGGPPDHGDAWSRRWRPDGDTLAVDGDGYRLRRRIQVDGRTVTASYQVTAEPGWRFIWAAHALLDLSTAARLLAPDGHTTLVSDPQMMRTVTWPYYDGMDLGRFGDVDGTALMIVLRDLDRVAVVDGADRLVMSLTAPGLPTSVAVWRNLGGWPEEAPYRSIGVEPMLGRIGQLSMARPQDAVTVPASGSVSWNLSITAERDGP